MFWAEELFPSNYSEIPLHKNIKNVSRFQNENRNHSCTFFAAKPQKTGLSAAIFWLRQKDFRFNPLRPTGFL
jgi:hypothetical protein